MTEEKIPYYHAEEPLLYENGAIMLRCYVKAKRLQVCQKTKAGMKIATIVFDYMTQTEAEEMIGSFLDMTSNLAELPSGVDGIPPVTQTNKKEDNNVK